MNRLGWAQLTSSRVVVLAASASLLGLGMCRWRDVGIVVVAMAGWGIVRYRRDIALFLLVGGGFLLIGYTRGQQILLPLKHSQTLVSQKVTLSGVVIDDPAYADHGQLESYVTHVRLVSGGTIPGRVRLRGFTLNLSRGDRIQASGKLQASFGGYSAAMYYAKIQVVGHDNGWANHLRGQFQVGLLNSLPEPHASFAFGLLVGARSGLPVDLNTELAMIGLTHIVAVSGYNLTIIIRASRRGLQYFSPRVGLTTSSILIACFLVVTGFSASIVRAAMVAGLSLLAGYYGRSVKPMILLMASAAITAGINPQFLWGDIGWWLSFLAFFGILVLAPVVRGCMTRKPRLWREIMIDSLCAIILTTPLIMFVFGRLSVVAPVSNLLILPLVPLAMLLSMFAGLAGMLTPRIAGLIALPARWLLGTMLSLMQQLSRFPGVQRQIRFDALQAGFCYGMIGVLYLLLRGKQRSKHGTINSIEQELL